MAPIKVSVLGFGMSATVFHLPFIFALPSLFELVSILERKATSDHSEVRKKFGDRYKVVTSLKEVLESEVELVFISTINETHYEFTKACLTAGKHVVVEKPLTPTSEEGYELATLAESRNLVLAVYQNRRWDSDFLTVKKLIGEGVLGVLSEFQSNYDRYKNFAATTKIWKEEKRPGSGSHYDLGSHLVDQILTLFGTPEKVTGLVRNSRLIGNSDVSDSFIIHCENFPLNPKSGLSKGSLCLIDQRRAVHYPPIPSHPSRSLPLIATAQGSILSLLNPQLRFLVKGTEATFIKHGLDVQENQLKENAEKAIDAYGYGVEPIEEAGKLYIRNTEYPDIPDEVISEDGNYKAFFENVAEAIQSRDPSRLAVKPHQAALVIKIIELAEKSSTEGRTLPFI